MEDIGLKDNESLRGPRCFLALPFSPEVRRVREAVREAALTAGFQPILLDEDPVSAFSLQERLVDEISQADCVVADLTERNPNVLYELGIARAMGKGLFLLTRRGSEISVPVDLQGSQLLLYELTREGLADLVRKLVFSLERYRRFPRRPVSVAGVWPSIPFLLDWERLERSEAENLCRELLVQMGYRRVDWDKGFREFDLIAELPRKDPDGFEYNEVWLISMGRNVPVEALVERLIPEAGFLMRRIFRDEERLDYLVSRNRGELSVIVLLIDLEARFSRTHIERIAERWQRFEKGSLGVRVRIWDRDYLSSIIRQFPQLGYKYFSEEGRAQSKYRKTPEELYRENVELAERQAQLITDLTEERNKRVRAERDAAWKDISFSAAHKIGNPIFAIETNLDPLHRRISEGRLEEALDIISRVRVSVEKAKGIVDQFKSLTRAQEIKAVPIPLRPILEDACKTARNRGVDCEIDCAESAQVQADPDRLSECFDELVANALHWFDKSSKNIYVRVFQPAPLPLPGVLDLGSSFTLIRFADNGCGVVVENKGRIFDAFFTTQDHGTGLGLALVRRIIEGHGGVILESGVPEQGADFEVYLPSASQSVRREVASKRRSKRGK